MSLESDLTSWNKKSKDDIFKIYERHSKDAGFIDRCVELLQVEPAQRGATWLLKHHTETSDSALSPAQVDNMLSRTSRMAHWESQLHVLQVLPYIQIPVQRKTDVEQFLRACLLSDNKFVRAWAYSGFADLAAQISEYRDEVMKILDTALAEETAPSVLARTRKGLAKL